MENRNEHIENLENLISDYEAKTWLNLDAWTELPTEEVFEDWLEDDFMPLWKKHFNEDFFEEGNALLTASLDRLDDIMDSNPAHIQTVK